MKRLQAAAPRGEAGSSAKFVTLRGCARRGPSRLLGSLLAALALGLGAPRSAGAEEPSPPQAPAAPRDPSAVERADALFKEARALAEQGKDREACEKFERSQALDPSPGTLLNIGNCYEPQGDLVRALATFERAFIDAQRTTNADRRELWTNAARERIASLSQRVPWISVRGAPPGTLVRLDGQPVEAGAGAMRINPGRHRVEHSAPGKRTYEQSFVIASGQRLAVNLPPLADAAPEPAATGPAAPATPATSSATASAYGLWPWVLGGSGAVLLGAGVVTGVLAKSKADQLERECGSGGCASSLEGVRDSGQALARATDILWISGALAAGAGVTLFLLDRGSEQGPEVQAGCFGAGCGVLARGQF